MVGTPESAGASWLDDLHRGRAPRSRPAGEPAPFGGRRRSNDAVSSRVLGRVHCPIGRGEQLIEVVAVLRVRCDPDRRRQPAEVGSLRQREPADCHPHRLRDHPIPQEASPGQESLVELPGGAVGLSLTQFLPSHAGLFSLKGTMIVVPGLLLANAYPGWRPMVSLESTDAWRRLSFPDFCVGRKSFGIQFGS